MRGEKKEMKVESGGREAGLNTRSEYPTWLTKRLLVLITIAFARVGRFVAGNNFLGIKSLM